MCPHKDIHDVPIAVFGHLCGQVVRYFKGCLPYENKCISYSASSNKIMSLPNKIAPF